MGRGKTLNSELLRKIYWAQAYWYSVQYGPVKSLAEMSQGEIRFRLATFPEPWQFEAMRYLLTLEPEEFERVKLLFSLGFDPKRKR